MYYFDMIHQKQKEIIELRVKWGQNVFTVNSEENQEEVAENVINWIKETKLELLLRTLRIKLKRKEILD